jgi:hypothetical protein
VWHAYDAMSHIVLESWFLYHSFFSFGYAPAMATHSRDARHDERVYGCAYGEGFFARFWMEYARADGRFAGADPNVVAMELLTVFVAGPIAFYVCWLVRRGDEGGVSFWAAVLAAGELYGGESLVLVLGFWFRSPPSPFFCYRRGEDLGEGRRALKEGGVCLMLIFRAGRVYDICAGMASWELKPGHQQFHVSVDLPRLLQHALDLLSLLDSLRGEEEFPRCLYGPYGECEKRGRRTIGIDF